MACFHPFPAWRLMDGSVVLVERGDVVSTLSLACGRCDGCRLERSKQWAIRCMHEASLHAENAFITLTYKTVPPGGSLRYEDFQLFMKRLRQYLRREDMAKGLKPQDFRKVRFFVCGEYGPKLDRPHFHACLFGIGFSDQVLDGKSRAGSKIFRSHLLESLWPLGYCSVGDVTFESASYVARYVTKKILGDLAEDHYRRIDPDTGEIFMLEPEFIHMSLRPGIGAGFFEKYRTDMYPHDYVIVKGRKMKPPRYYDKRFKKLDPDGFEVLQDARVAAARADYLKNGTDERLAVRELVSRAAASRFKRDFIKE